MNKVQVIKRSLFCYNLSWLALVPLVGIIPAIATLQVYATIRRDTGEEWNPARSYALWGLILADIGLLESLICWALLSLAIAGGELNALFR